MKVIVKRYFADAYTGKRYEAGGTFTGTAERVAELRGAGVLEAGEVAEDDIQPGSEQGASAPPSGSEGGASSAGHKVGSGNKRTR